MATLIMIQWMVISSSGTAILSVNKLHFLLFAVPLSLSLYSYHMPKRKLEDGSVHSLEEAAIIIIIIIIIIIMILNNSLQSSDSMKKKIHLMKKNLN